MAGKTSNHLKQFLSRFRMVRAWQLFLILIPLLFVTATLLRLEHLQMVELRDEVIAADESDNDERLQKALIELQKYTVSHVVVNVVETNGVQNVTFGTGVFYLENQYLRAANAAIEDAQNRLLDDSNPNGNIYAAASAVCRPQAIANGWRWTDQRHLDCWMNELAKYPAADNLETNFTANVPSTELYRREFDSPIWAPSPAGWAMLACFIIIVIIAIRLIIWCVVKITLLIIGKR